MGIFRNFRKSKEANIIRNETDKRKEEYNNSIPYENDYSEMVAWGDTTARSNAVSAMMHFADEFRRIMPVERLTLPRCAVLQFSMDIKQLNEISMKRSFDEHSFRNNLFPILFGEGSYYDAQAEKNSLNAILEKNELRAEMNNYFNIEINERIREIDYLRRILIDVTEKMKEMIPMCLNRRDLFDIWVGIRVFELMTNVLEV